MRTPFLLAIFLSLPLAAQTLLVAAASDLSPSESDLRVAFQSASGLVVRFVFGSSGMLAEQIREGAPFDVYLSANEDFVSSLSRAGRLDPATVRVYATGRLGLWSASGRFRSLEDLRGVPLRHLAIANPRHAPYGVAAEQLLRRRGLWSELESRIVYGENVRQAYEYARTGNCDAVITAWSLLYHRRATLLDASDHAPIRQSGAVVRASAQAGAAARFLDFLLAPTGRAILAAHGLFPVSAPARAH